MPNYQVPDIVVHRLPPDHQLLLTIIFIVILMYLQLGFVTFGDELG